MEPMLLPVGDSALMVRFGDGIDAAANDRVMALDRELQRTGSPVLDTVPSYGSLLVIYDAIHSDFGTVAAHILSCCAKMAVSHQAARVWRVPVIYGGLFGFDLDELAQRHQMTAAAAAERHRRARYRVYMIGFMPGFAYLGGLDPVLATPRRATPRLSIPAGSITIGGEQTAVTSVEAPSGWHVIGRTPVRTFMPDREPACLFAAGDMVEFQQMRPEQWEPLSHAAAAGDPVATIVS